MDRAPVIIGVGEASERIDASDYAALSPADLAGRAALAALHDALSPAALAPHVASHRDRPAVRDLRPQGGCAVWPGGQLPQSRGQTH